MGVVMVNHHDPRVREQCFQVQMERSVRACAEGSHQCHAIDIGRLRIGQFQTGLDSSRRQSAPVGLPGELVLLNRGEELAVAHDRSGAIVQPPADSEQQHR